MDLRILKYILRETRSAIQRTTRNAFAIATKVAFGTAFEIITVLAVGVGFAVGMTSCHTTKHIAKAKTETKQEETQQEVAEQEAQTTESQWHTCLMQNAQGVVTIGEQTLRATCTMQTVRDSIVILSIMPMLGIEMLRIEATPEQITGIDKINRQYAVATYEEVNRYLQPAVSYNDLQALATGELPTGKDEAFVGYTAGKQTIMLRLTYPARQTDVPVRTRGADLTRYQQIDIKQLLK